MSEITAKVEFDLDELADVIGNFVNEQMRNHNDEFMRRLIGGIEEFSDLAEHCVENISYDSLIEGVSENIRYNYIDEVATSIADDIVTSLADNVEFCDFFEKHIDEAIEAKYGNLNEILTKQAIAISTLTQIADSMQTKKFWKKLIK